MQRAPFERLVVLPAGNRHGAPSFLSGRSNPRDIGSVCPAACLGQVHTEAGPDTTVTSVIGATASRDRGTRAPPLRAPSSHPAEPWPPEVVPCARRSVPPPRT